MVRRVVITGMGTVNPLGQDIATTWAAVMTGKSGIRMLPELEKLGLKSPFGGQVPDFDPQALFGRRDARRMDRVTHMALAAANQAVDQAQLTGNEFFDRDRVGVVLGSAVGGLGAVVDNEGTFQNKGSGRVSPFFIPMMLSDSVPGQISIVHGFRGPNMNIATACASANNAIGEAAQIIRRDAADVMLTGGSEASLLPLLVAGFNSMGALSTHNGDPEHASRPFDRQRDGFVSAEGAAIIVLEELEHARARGATIYAEFLGYGSSADAYHVSTPAEDGGGAVLSMRWGLADAGLEIEDIDYINAHGTSTPLNDKTETLAIKRVFGERAYAIPVSSTKAIHGHLLGAGGGLEALISVQALQEQIIPPTWHYTHPDPDCDLDYVTEGPRPGRLNRIMSNSFGFGGHNATIILGKYPDV
jgi:3-oxoacyl-[acyl-carrier-protein] synthase II